MKKIATVAMSCVLTIGMLASVDTVRASSAFDVLDSNGVFTDGTLSTPLPVGATVQVIWSADNAYAPGIAGQLDSAGYLANASDYILFEGSSSILGGWLGDLDGSTTYTSANVGGNPLPSGFVYVRVFQDGTPTAGEQYADSSLVPVINQQTNVPPDLVDVVDIAPSSGVFPNKTIAAIPEPSVLAFCGIGSMLMAYRRRKMQKA